MVRTFPCRAYPCISSPGEPSRVPGWLRPPEYHPDPPSGQTRTPHSRSHERHKHAHPSQTPFLDGDPPSQRPFLEKEKSAHVPRWQPWLMGTARDTRGHTQENYPKHTNIQELSNMALKYVKYKILYISSTLYQPSDQFNIYAISGDHTCVPPQPCCLKFPHQHFSCGTGWGVV